MPHRLPPSLGLLTINALTAADSVLIPIQTEYYALEGVTALVSTVSRLQHSVNKALQLEGVVLTMYDGRTNLSLQVASQVKKHFRGKVFSAIIPATYAWARRPAMDSLSTCMTRAARAPRLTARWRRNWSNATRDKKDTS